MELAAILIGAHQKARDRSRADYADRLRYCVGSTAGYFLFW